MAEHTRHQLARSGFPLRPRSIQTLAHVLNDWSPLAEAPKPLLHLLVSQALDRIRPARFAAVAEFPGFVRALADLFDEIPDADALPGDLARLFLDVEQALRARSLGFRNARILQTAERIQPAAHTILDGFFTLAPAEVGLVLALAKRTEVTVTLPDWPGATRARQALLAASFSEEASGAGPRPAAASQAAQHTVTTHDSVLRRARRSGGPPQAKGPAPQGGHTLGAVKIPAGESLFSAATIEREVEEIARRILEHVNKGRLFRDIAIVLRARNPYGPLVETTLARFGIPARMYFSDPLGSHPAVACLATFLRAMLAGWDHATLLSALRMPVAGTPSSDRLDFEWRVKLPGKGLPLPSAQDRLTQLDGWRRERLPPGEWAERLKTLRTLLPVSEIADRISRDQVHVWRSTAAALAAFDQALDGVAIALSGVCSLETFWKQAELALSLEPLRVPDLRRNVVHVMDAYEARQWKLPVVFVCGLTERYFPQYHREDSILGDSARRRMGLDTAASRQLEERFLFEIATTRATEETVLSYPRYDEKGEETLPSFFLNGAEAESCEVRVAPAPSAVRDRPQLKAAPSLSELHRTLSPTSIESFLQCPFQFFARKTLRLRERPPAPRDRLDVLLQGSILHRALAEWIRAPLLGTAILEQVFDDECSRARVPATHRMEAVRLELLRNFRGFLEDTKVALPGWTVRVEEKFKLLLNPQVAISGRIDRIDISPAGQALVIDYKYSAGNKIRERVEDSSEGHLVQGGLYLLAAERVFALDPAGMLYCGLRKDVTWDGWHRAVPELASIGTSSTREALRDLMDIAEGTAVRIHDEIVGGRIAVSPADTNKCKWCEYRDICRVESMPVVQSAGGV